LPVVDELLVEQLAEKSTNPRSSPPLKQ